MKFFISTDTHAMLPVAHRLRLEGHDVETVVYKARFRKAWSRADTPIMTSCLCVPKT